MDPLATKINGAPRVPLGELIELTNRVNSNNEYGCDSAKGMTITKEIIPTKANLTGSDLSKFLVVYPEEFVYNPRTHGKKIGLGYNSSDRPFIISWNNTAFKVKDTTKLVPFFLYLILNREEWDREATFRSWGSSTEVFSWSEFCLMTIPLPSIEVQREYVAAYRSLQQLAEQNEALAKPLQDACNAFLTNAKGKYPLARLGGHIMSISDKNIDGAIDLVLGLSTQKRFREPNSRVNKKELTKYKIVKAHEFAYVPTTDTWKVFACALNDTGSTIVVSPIYIVFCCDSSFLPEFLHLWFKRAEFDRLARYNSWGSARENFNFEDLCLSKIPLPPIDVQRSIVALYHCAEEARAIAREAREQLKTLAPAMVQRAANTPTI